MNPAPRLLGAFPPGLSDYAARALGTLGVEVRLDAAVEKIDQSGVFASGTRINSANVFWCAGTEARPAASWLGVDAARNGAVKVRPDCSIPGDDKIFAIGDVACLGGQDGRPLPGLAAVATQHGKYVAEVIARRIAGRSAPGPFRYRNRGTLAVIGRSRAVADLGRVQLRGFPAWLFWSVVHLFLLAGFRNRIIVYINWSWGLVHLWQRCAADHRRSTSGRDRNAGVRSRVRRRPPLELPVVCRVQPGDYMLGGVVFVDVPPIGSPTGTFQR